MKKLNNKGLSLVELLISIAVFSIVMIAMFTVLSTATRSYNKNRAEAQAQNEAQSLMAQLENIIQDATQGVYVRLNDPQGPTNKMIVCYDDYFSMLWWDGTDVYFFKFDGSLDPNLAAGTEYKNASTGSAKSMNASLHVYTMLQVSHIADYRNEDRNKFILAENIESISIVPNNTYSYVSVSFVVNVDGSKYTAKKNIEIRNNTEKRSSSPSSGGGSSSGSSSEGGSSEGGSGSEGGSSSGGSSSGGSSSGGSSSGGSSSGGSSSGGGSTPTKTLESITAAYGAGAIYPGTSILRNNVVVTASYDDGSTEVIGAWTSPNSLSGDDYTSNIDFQVNYKDKSATVTIPWYDLVGFEVIAKHEFVAGETVSESDFTAYNTFGDGQKKETSLFQLVGNNNVVEGNNQYTFKSLLKTDKQAVVNVNGKEVLKDEAYVYVTNKGGFAKLWLSYYGVNLTISDASTGEVLFTGGQNQGTYNSSIVSGHKDLVFKYTPYYSSWQSQDVQIGFGDNGSGYKYSMRPSTGKTDSITLEYIQPEYYVNVTNNGGFSRFFVAYYNTNITISDADTGEVLYTASSNQANLDSSIINGHKNLSFKYTPVNTNWDSGTNLVIGKDEWGNGGKYTTTPTTGRTDSTSLG